ncbi:MAG TPA: protein-L-isoaspartate(D-aspartate) O-methyltransferase [Syntrophaceae bacterium]|nr:protein-L-isoaspartate(D-aspartate) O-methyltransferase [Syntrophaceae bacterium]
MKDFRTAREKMVQTQIAARGIRDERVLQAMLKVPRHLFVDEALQDQAYNDYPLPIGENQTISQPYMVALMTEALELRGSERVLEIGTGSGYQTAILAELSEKVYSIERIPSLLEKARKILDKLKYFNVVLKVDNGTYGWKEEAPFHAILVTAGAPEIPQPLLEQLGVDGRLAVPLGDRFSQSLIKVTKKEDGRLIRQNLGGCRFVSLIGKYGWKE